MPAELRNLGRGRVPEPATCARLGGISIGRNFGTILPGESSVRDRRRFPDSATIFWSAGACRIDAGDRNYPPNCIGMPTSPGTSRAGRGVAETGPKLRWIFRDCSCRCSSRADASALIAAIRRGPIQPWLRVAGRHALPYQRRDRSRGCGLRGTVGGPGEVHRRASRRPGFARMAIARRDFRSSKASLRLEGLFAFRPTKKDTHASRVAPTSAAKAADRLGRGSRVGGRCPAPGRAGVCAWACGLARLASPDSPATYGLRGIR